MTDHPASSALPLLGLALLLAFLPYETAWSQHWAQVPDEARATLPAPEPGSPFSGGELSCEAQVWTLTLSTGTGEPLAGADGTATLTIGRANFEAKAQAIREGVAIEVPRRAVEPLSAMLGFTVAFQNSPARATFGLAGSRRAIAAAGALCSPRIMPTQNSVPLTPYSSYAGLARLLRAQDIADFTLSTTAEPALRAGMVEAGQGRRLLFGELCGSSWYYGASGCSLVGFAPAGGDAREPEGWKPVYESEGAFLYLDPGSSQEGWPDLVSHPLDEEAAETRWRWNGERYALWRGVEIGDVADEIRR